MPSLRDGKTRSVTQKKTAPAFTATRNSFPETRVRFCHWVTGITRPNNWSILRHDLHDNRWINKIRKICSMKKTMTAEKLTRLLLKKIFADHNIFEQIISDKNKLFTSKFNTGLRETLRVKEGMFTVFHPQPDGQTKRMNQTLEQYLRLFTGDNKHKWVELLPTT